MSLRTSVYRTQLRAVGTSIAVLRRKTGAIVTKSEQKSKTSVHNDDASGFPSRNAFGDYVCEHGTAMDVHCCNCHSGFLFDLDSCTCDPGRLVSLTKAEKRLWPFSNEHTIRLFIAGVLFLLYGLLNWFTKSVN